MPAPESRRNRRSMVIVAGSVLFLAACNDDGRELETPVFPTPETTTTTIDPTTIDPESPAFNVTQPATPAPAPMQLLAPWGEGAAIPVRYTCDDADVAPALSWSNVPAGTVELALTLTDPDAGFTHWVVTGINAARTTLAEGEQPVEATVRVNDFGQAAWGGPCPPIGDGAHTYLLTLHALNQQVEVADDAPAIDVISLLNQTALLQSTVSGTYARTE